MSCYKAPEPKRAIKLYTFSFKKNDNSCEGNYGVISLSLSFYWVPLVNYFTPFIPVLDKNGEGCRRPSPIGKQLAKNEQSINRCLNKGLCYNNNDAPNIYPDTNYMKTAVLVGGLVRRHHNIIIFFIFY